MVFREYGVNTIFEPYSNYILKLPAGGKVV